jgi:hypothetical protein
LLQNKTLDRKKGSGRIAKIATPTVRKAIKRMFNHKSGRSQKKSANLFNIRSKKDWTLSVEIVMMPYNLIFL